MLRSHSSVFIGHEQDIGEEISIRCHGRRREKMIINFTA